MVEAFFALLSKKKLILLFWPIFGIFWCPVTLVTFSSNLSNFENYPKNPKIKENPKNPKSPKEDGGGARKSLCLILDAMTCHITILYWLTCPPVYKLYSLSPAGRITSICGASLVSCTQKQISQRWQMQTDLCFTKI